MKRLADEASRRGLSLNQLATIVGRKPESLMRSFLAVAPRLETVELVCDGMRLGRRVARALLGALDIRDESEIVLDVASETTRCASLFADLSAVMIALGESLKNATRERRRNASARFEIAKRGLLFDRELGAVAAAPALLAFCHALPLDLQPYLATSATIDARQLEAAAALEWLLTCVALNEPDEKAIVDAVRERGIVREKMVFRGALFRAQAEFRRSIGHEYSYADAVNQLIQSLEEDGT